MIYPKVFLNINESEVELTSALAQRLMGAVEAETSGQTGRVSMKNRDKKLARSDRMARGGNEMP